MHNKFIPATHIHTHRVGTVAGYADMRKQAAQSNKRERNMRDVAHCGQSPTMRQAFAPQLSAQ